MINLNVYNSRTNVNRGLSKSTRAKNIVAQKKKERQQQETTTINKSGAEILLDIYAPKDIDMKDPEGFYLMNSGYRIKTVEGLGKIESEAFSKMMDDMFNQGIFEQLAQSTTSPSQMMMRAVDLNEKLFASTAQKTKTFSSIHDLRASFDYLNKVRANQGKLFIFDTETIGGKNRTGIWNPLAITEFAMQEYDYATGKTTATNIVMGLADNDDNQRVYKEITDYMKQGNWRAIEENEELAVTAHRAALYANAKMNFNKELGYFEITELGDGEDWKNIETFKSGWENLKYAYKHTAIDEATGMRKSDLAYYSSISKMHGHLKKGNAMAVGQNFQIFDEPVVNTQLKKTLDYYTEIVLDTSGVLGKARDISREQATKAVGYMSGELNFMGGGFTLPNQQTLDTLPFFKVALDAFGANTLMNGNREVIKKAGGGLAKQEYVGEAWFEDLFASSMAHMADFDVTVLNYALTHNLEKTDNMPLIDYIATKMGEDGTGIFGIDDKAKKIKSGQVFYSQAGLASFDYSGKGPLNFSYNNTTGEIFTSSGYNFVNGKNLGYSPQNFNMGSTITKGNFYELQSVKKISAKDLHPSLGRVLPDMSGSEFIIAQFKMATPEGIDATGMEDITYNMLFNSEKQFSGYMSSSMKMAVDIDENGKQYIVEGMESLFDKMVQNPYAEGELISEIDLANMNEVPINEQYLINRTLGDSLDRFQTTKAYNSIMEYDNSYKNVKKLVEAKHLLDKANVEKITKSEFNDLLNGKKIRKLSEEKSKKLTNDLREIFEFENYKIKEKMLYSNTQRNLVNAWDFISSKDAFYTTVLQNLDEVATAKNWNNEQCSIAFKDLVETMRIQAAELISSGNDKQDRNRITSKRKAEVSKQKLIDTYDFKIPQSFKIDTSSEIMNIDSFSSSQYRDILRLNLDNANEHFYFISKLRKAMYGEREPLASTETLDRTAMTRFINNVLSKDKNFTKEHLKEIRTITTEENYNVNEAAMKILDIMKKQIKTSNPAAGILREIDLPSLNEDDLMTKTLNSDAILGLIPYNAKHNMINPINTKLLLNNNGKGMVDFVNNDVMKFFMPDRKAFENSIAHLTSDQKLVKNTLYDKLYSDISNQLVDIFSIGSKIDDAEMSISSEGDIIFARHGKAINIKGVPRVGLNNGHLYGIVGNQELNLHLDVGYTNSGYGYLKTNLGDIFERNKYISKNITNKIKSGEFEINDFLNFTNKLAEELREEAMYSGTSGELQANFLLGTGELNKLFYDIFGTVEDSSKGLGKNFLEKLNLPPQVKEAMIKAYGDSALRKDPLKDDLTEMDPQLRALIGPYRVNIMRELAKVKNKGDMDTTFYDIIDKANFSTKDKSKAGKDKLQIGGGRFHVGFTNAIDENSRPVIGGAGNVFYLDEDNIKEAVQKFGGILSDGSLFESDETRYINKISKDVLGNGTTTFTGRTAYVGEIGITTILKNNFNRVMADNTVGAGLGDKKEKIYNYLYSFVNTFEQAKLFSAEAFDVLTGGNMAADKQRLTLSKDIAGGIDLDDPLIKQKFDDLYSVKGKIIRAEDGTLAYVSSNGKIVKHGDAIIPYASYGGTTKNWVSKMQRGVLGYEITDKEKRVLSDKNISALLNKYADSFEGIDMNNESLTNTILEKILRKEGLIGSFVIEDINKTTLPKILINDAEKSMNHLGYMRIGTLNEKIAGVLTAYGDETKDLIGTAVPTEKALRAYFKDESKTKTVLDAFGFDSMSSFIKAVKEESYAADRMLFGKGGVFEGFAAIGNDNLLGHKNKGSMMTGAINDAVEMLGKYLNNGVESVESRQKGLEEFVRLVNANGEKFKFFKDSKGTGYEFEIEDGSLMLKSHGGLKQGLYNADVVDAKRLGDLLEYIDGINKNNFGSDIPLLDRLVHKDDEGKKIIGRMVYSDSKHEGGAGSAGMKIVIESEKQSGMNAEFIEAKQQLQDAKIEKEKLNEIRATRKLTQKELEQAMILDNQIVALQNKVMDLTETGHLYEFGDRERSIMAQAIISKDVLDHADIEDLRSNEAIRGVDLTKYSDDVQVFDWLEEELLGQGYYNRYEEDLLTKEMLDRDEYKHLKGVYEDIVEKRGKNLGVENAENIFGIRMVALANKFNNNLDTMSIDDLVNAGFEAKTMTPMEYSEAFSNIGIDSDNAVVKRNVIIDLGKQFDSIEGVNRYVAVPGMGAIVGDTDIKKAWHTEAKKMVSYYEKEYMDLHGQQNEKAEQVMKKLQEKVAAVGEATGSYTKKKDLYDSRASRKVYAAMDRTKLMSLPDHANPLLDQAMVHGKSIAAWQKESVYYDAVFDSEEQFRKRGFFSDATKKKFGMTTDDEMRQYLMTHGATMVDDRYPNIRETSLTTARHYLMDKDYMHATNAAYTTKATMLKILGDSDGDSASRFLLEHKGVSHAQYEHARIQAIEGIKKQRMTFENDDARESYIKGQVLKTGIGEDTYENFRKVDLYSLTEAATINELYHRRADETILDDYGKTKKSQTIMSGDKYTIAEYDKGQSSLSREKLLALNYDPTFEQVETNIKEVDNMFKILENDVNKIQDSTLKGEIKDLLAKHTTISDNPDELPALDKALYAMEVLHKQGDISTEALNKVDSSVKQRVRTLNYHSEILSKLGITAVGNVNFAFSGAIQASRNYFSSPNVSADIRARSKIMTAMGYEAEQASISSKKVVLKAGDTRVIDLGDILKQIQTSNGNYGNFEDGSAGDQLFRWMKTNIAESKTLAQYQNITRKNTIPGHQKLDVKKDKDAILKFMYEQTVKGYADVYANETTRQVATAYSKVGTKNANPYAISYAQGMLNNNFLGQAAEDITGVEGTEIPEGQKIKVGSSKDLVDEEGKQIIRRFEQNSSDEAVNMVKDSIGRMKKWATASTNATSKGKALTMGVLGLAGGLIAAGYASGNPLNDANPEQVAQKQTNTRMSFGPEAPQMAPNNTGGYIINIKGDTKKGNRQLKRAMKQAANASVGGGVNINMSLRTSREGGYTDRDIENILNNYF